MFFSTVLSLYTDVSQTMKLYEKGGTQLENVVIQLKGHNSSMVPLLKHC